MAARLSEGGRDEVLFVGTPNGLESSLVPKAGVPFRALPARGFDRSRPLSLIVAIGVLKLSTLRAVTLLRRYKPDAVVGFGGYVSIPVGLAAVLTGVPLVLHEQNSVPGLANRLLSRWASDVGVTYPGSAAQLAHPERVRVTGNPVRRAVLDADRTAARSAAGYADTDVVLLVFGGSRGARHMNDAMLNLYSRLMQIPELRVVHVAGTIDAASVGERLAAKDAQDGRYQVLEYLDDMGSALAAADLVLARAGATSIAEITALGRPSVLVPYPFATDDHQTLNARAVQEAGAGALVADADLDGPAFAEELLRLLADEQGREAMAAAASALGRPHAGDAVADMARETAENRGRTR